MLVIGLTGPSGAGKSEVSRVLKDCGATIIDADAVYHALLIPPSPCLDALCETFGTDILSPTGNLDRRKLGSIVFSDPNALHNLNTITHRYVMEDVRQRLAELRKVNTRLAVLDAPQLFEAGAERDCDTVISVLADKQLRADRIMTRDGIDRESAMRRINAQMSDDYFRTHSDYIIENNGACEDLIPTVRRILCEIGGVTD
ncbi:MAG: dephospho-CoA kinase [Clostridia bacterium]|nr:dephospho-CoA kinase [Clostridia bacterium]